MQTLLTMPEACVKGDPPQLKAVFFGETATAEHLQQTTLFLCIKYIQMLMPQTWTTPSCSLERQT